MRILVSTPVLMAGWQYQCWCQCQDGNISVSANARMAISVSVLMPRWQYQCQCQCQDGNISVSVKTYIRVKILSEYLKCHNGAIRSYRKNTSYSPVTHRSPHHPNSGINLFLKGIEHEKSRSFVRPSSFIIVQCKWFLTLKFACTTRQKQK
ncbi:uncharacterized protein LOC116848503 [Odontomachus brunneus]|uniref:uncharacterized protein LOC116848503 n=1 Tax=Odontomachus brunneus TaxID=486640 RepID=UPI0013F23AE9|nr:uncharacterized protein LOC116848503 [Odontomachus brunneus]